MQPGIESLSTHVLQLMRKGITAIQNVRLLKWATYYGITTPWNVITGFPGERTEDYERQLATMRLIPHLQPPVTVGRLSLERFSPYFTEAEQQGFREVRPEQSYACIYPPHLRHERIAYFFAYEAPNTLPDEAHTPLGEYVRWWKEAWRAPRIPYLYYLRGAGRLTVIDGRDVASPRVHAFDEPAALAYELCTPTQHAAPRVLAHLRDACGLDTDLGAVQHILEAFVVGGLMLEEDGHYLSLAVPANPNW
jgi:hypothetical protein